MRRRPRPPEETERIYGSEERREWMTRQPCVFCGRRPSVSAHVRTGGGSRKADASETVPMCSGCHDGYDGRAVAGGRATFLAARGLTLDDVLELAAAIESRWQQERAVERAW